MQVSVLLKGTLRGMGMEGECDLVARRNPASERGRFDYSEVVIIQSPPDFPDGDYTLIFEGLAAAVRHRGVLWTVQIEPAKPAHPAGHSEEASEFAAGVMQVLKKFRGRARNSLFPEGNH